MKKEIVYVHNVQIVIPLNKFENFWGGSFPDQTRRKINKIERIGEPFSFMTKHTFEDIHSKHYQPELIFKDLIEGKPYSLERYLEEANIKFSYKNNHETQYLGIMHGKPNNTFSRKSILPCQFYLIKDKFK
jgi:hypothetical protein